jgi:parallel beta-helix repeat protein
MITSRAPRGPRHPSRPGLPARRAAAAAAAALLAAAAASQAAARPALAAPAPARPATARLAPARPALRAPTPAPPATARPVTSWRAVVTTLRDAGPGSLRAAIRRADARPPGAATTIRFAVAGTITLRSALPAVTRPVTIDGTTAPGYRAGGAPRVAVDCHGHPGLLFAPGSARSRLLGVAVGRAGGAGVTLAAGQITLTGDYIGLTRGGAPAGNRGDGIDVTPRSGRDRIGLNPSRQPGVVANVISGNRGSGIVLDGSRGTTVAASRVGTNPAGTAAIGNGGSGLVLTGGASGNEIGGTAFTDPATGQANNPTGTKGTVTPVFVVPALGNLISGNARTGVLIDARSARNTLNGNFIGTTADGDGRLGNGGDGVWIIRSAGNALTGCTFVNNPFVYYNVISANRGSGLRITSADRTVVQGNFFGTAADNAAVLGNRRDGILVQGTSAQTQVGGVIPLGNVSAGNGRNGIEVTGRASHFTTFNTFGGLFAFGGAAPNGRDGVLITSSGRGNLVRTNVMSGNRGSGIELAGSARGVTVDPDIAGLTTKGNAVLPNGGDGLLIDGHASGNVIGGTLRSVIPQDTFSGNDGYGIAITGHAFGNRVFGAFAGPEILGRTGLGNRRGGVLIGGRAYRNVIGALTGRLPVNLISGNHGPGVTLARGTRGNAVLRNFIGRNRFGRPLPNAGPAIINRGTRNLIRGNVT